MQSIYASGITIINTIHCLSESLNMWILSEIKVFYIMMIISSVTMVTVDKRNLGLTQVPNDFDANTVTLLLLDNNNIPNPVFSSLPQLVQLNMVSSSVATFPDISQMSLLEILNLQHNQLTDIPEFTTNHPSGECALSISLEFDELLLNLLF